MTRNERIIELVKRGMSYRRVALELGVTRDIVAGVCWRAGVKMSPEHISKNLSEASSGKSNRRGHFSPRATRALELRREGYSYRAIAEALGYASDRSAASVVKVRERGEARA